VWLREGLAGSRRERVHHREQEKCGRGRWEAGSRSNISSLSGWQQQKEQKRWYGVVQGEKGTTVTQGEASRGSKKESSTSGSSSSCVGGERRWSTGQQQEAVATAICTAAKAALAPAGAAAGRCCSRDKNRISSRSKQEKQQ
jgi:hypothetical protein